MLEARPLARPESLKDLAYREIKNHLTAGKLSPDEIYSAAQFADILQVSRTPVREALLQLATEGYLVFIEGRGFKVRPYSEKEIRDFFEVRRLVELYVAERLAGSIVPEDVRQLEEKLETMKRCSGTGDSAGFLEADRSFHLLLARRLDNRMLESIMDTIRDRISVFALRALTRAGRVDQVLREHGRIVEAFRSGDRAAIVAATREHLEATERHVLGA